MTKFIIHKDSLLYTTHGFLSAEHLYNVYKSEGLKKDCCLVGWKPRGEIYGKIFSIDEFDSDAGFVVSFREYGRPEKQCYYYVGSKLMDKDMNYIELSESVEPFMAVFVQGFVDCTNIVKICKDDMQKFYVIESNIDNIHINTSVLHAVDEKVEENNTFFG